jgi:DNA-directed RNA polymerase specialized sigma subunit
MTFKHKPVIRQKNTTDPTVTAKYYLSNSKLLPAVIQSKEQGRITSELAEMLMMLATRYASRPQFALYTYREDMVSEALTDLCKNALKFNTEKSNNPFAYYTSCIHNSFLGFLNVEKKHRKIRDQLLIEVGENPSYAFEAEYRNNIDNEGVREDMTELRGDIEEAKIRVAKDKIYEAEKALAEALAKAAELAAAGPALLQFDDDTLIGDLPEVAIELTFIDTATPDA